MQKLSMPFAQGRLLRILIKGSVYTELPLDWTGAGQNGGPEIQSWAAAVVSFKGPTPIWVTHYKFLFL